MGMEKTEDGKKFKQSYRAGYHDDYRPTIVLEREEEAVKFKLPVPTPLKCVHTHTYTIVCVCVCVCIYMCMYVYVCGRWCIGKRRGGCEI